MLLAEIQAWPENPGAFAFILNAAGISWTLSSDLAAYDSINYGLRYDDAQSARVALKQGARSGFRGEIIAGFCLAQTIAPVPTAGAHSPTKSSLMPRAAAGL